MSEVEPTDAGPEPFKAKGLELSGSAGRPALLMPPGYEIDQAAETPVVQGTVAKLRQYELNAAAKAVAEARMWALERLALRPEETPAAELALLACQIAGFIVPGSESAAGVRNSNTDRFAFKFLDHFRSRVAPIAGLIADAEYLARFIETGETDVTSLGASSSGCPQSPSESPPVAPQSPSAPPESHSQSDLPSQVSIGGVATPMVAGRNDADNGVVSTPIPGGGA